MRLVPRCAVPATYGNRERRIQKCFLPPERKSKTKEQRLLESRYLFVTQHQMRYAIYIPLNAEYLTLELTMVAYEKRQNAIKFARANNVDLLRALKHLTETSLY